MNFTPLGGCARILGPGRRRLVRLAFVAAVTLSAAPLRAEVRCAIVFGDHMVLQRGRPVPLWGGAAPGETVTAEFAGQRHSVTAGADGRWHLMLDPMAASEESRTLTVCGTNAITFTDVLVGEVWLCSGQSNMEKPLGPRPGQKPTDNYEAEIRAADHPLLRLYQMPHSGKPAKGVIGLQWVICSPETIAGTRFSAVGYFFGRELRRELHVPIGVIHSSFGGTMIEAWMPPDAFEREPGLRGRERVRFPAWVEGVQATELYTSMIAPLVPYAVRGFLWYQGETNCLSADGAIYTAKMRALVASWRAAWHDGNLPFFYAQIAPFDYYDWDKVPKHLTPDTLPLFWEAQTRALAIPHTGMIVTTDLAADPHDIHPTNKRDIGRRFARLALAATYGRNDILAQSPRYATMQLRPGGKIALRFDFAGTGLQSRDGQPLTYFTIAGADRKFVPAATTLEGDTAVVSSPDVAQPVAVRFAWADTATPNLVNSAGLPAIPFRTDDWPVALAPSFPAAK